jgi:heptosyltransferase-2
MIPSDERPTKPELVVFGVFKGIGDLLNAAPTIADELHRGSRVVVLIFPNRQLESLLGLLDLHAICGQLAIEAIPVSFKPAGVLSFWSVLRRLDPNFIWISPHSARVSSSWKIPILLWLMRALGWRQAKLAGAESEKFSMLFDIRVPIDRHLPYADREWTAFSMAKGYLPVQPLRPISFLSVITKRTNEFPIYDLAMHPGASTENKRWPSSYYADLLGRLPQDWRIALVGLQSEVKEIMDALSDTRQLTVVTGTLRDAIEAMARARVVLTMDSSSRHLASLLSVPVISLFGPSNFQPATRSNADAVQLSASGLSCQPCERRQCRYQIVYCMQMISPVVVAERLLQIHESSVKRRNSFKYEQREGAPQRISK